MIELILVPLAFLLLFGLAMAAVTTPAWYPPHKKKLAQKREARNGSNEG